MKENIYLIPLANGTYAPCVAEKAPRESAILLASECSYPTVVSYLEFDVYGCEHLCEEPIKNRAELLDLLFTCGEMCWHIVGLWEYDSSRHISDELIYLFETAYKTRMEAVRGDGAVNAAYAFVDTITLGEYCALCKRRGGRMCLTNDQVPTELNVRANTLHLLKR